MEKFRVSKLLSSATKDTPEPTPGYMYEEIAKLTFEGMGPAGILVDLLLKQLGKSQSPFVLQKTLRVVKMTCEKGHPDFKKEMQRHLDKLRACAGFRGKADEVHGDKLNQAVRDAAQQAIDAAFAAQKTHNPTKDISGQGAVGVTPVSSTFTTGTPVMGGSGPTPPVANRLDALGDMFGNVKTAVSSGFGYYKPTEHDKILSTMYQEQHQSGEYRPPTEGQPFGQRLQTKPQESTFRAPEPVQQAAAEEEQTAEEQLVKRVLDQSKTPSLSRAALNEFVAAVQTSDLLLLCPLLEERLSEKTNWQLRLRTLCAIETLVAGGYTDIGEYFVENPDDILKNCNVAQDSLRDKAEKVAKSLGIEPKVKAKAPVQATPASPQSGIDASLDFEGLTVRPKKKDDAAAKPAAGTANTLKKRKPKADLAMFEADEPAPSLLPASSPTAARPAAAPAAPSSGTDLLDDFLFSQPVAKPAPKPAPAAAAAPADAFDPFAF